MTNPVLRVKMRSKRARRVALVPPRFLTISDSVYARAREGECELGTLAIGKRCQERISATGWAW